MSAVVGTSLRHDLREATPTRSVALEFRETKWIPWSMFLADVLALELALACGVAVRWLLAPYLTATLRVENFAGIALGVLSLPLVNFTLGLYPGYCRGPVDRLRRRLCATTAVFGALVAWDGLVLHGQWSRGVLLATFAFALVLPLIFQDVLRSLLIRSGRWGVPVVVLAAAATASSLVRVFRRQPELGLVPIVVLDDNLAASQTEIEGVPSLGPSRLACALTDVGGIAVVALPGAARAQSSWWLQRLHFRQVIVIPDVVGLQTHWVQARDFGGYLGLEIRKQLLVPANRILKRAVDYVVGVPAMLLSLPLIGLFALLIKRVSPGPAFYAQKREGRNGRHFRMWKLRTMRPNADLLLRAHLERSSEDRKQWFGHFKLRHDPRIVPGIGHFLRRTSLDELPQLWNVLRGEMSLVGPRPFPPYHLAQFSQDFRTLRRSVLPGMTGLWQVSERSNGDLAVQEELDTYYIRNWSLWMDLYVLLRTFRAVLTGSGAY
jgi:Undecaprenyl-phosphate galactose phosphotransferase WbaP